MNVRVQRAEPGVYTAGQFVVNGWGESGGHSLIPSDSPMLRAAEQLEYARASLRSRTRRIANELRRAAERVEAVGHACQPAVDELLQVLAELPSPSQMLYTRDQARLVLQARAVWLSEVAAAGGFRDSLGREVALEEIAADGGD